MEQNVLAARLKSERMRRGLTLKEAAAGAGTDRQSLSRIEQGRQTATPATVRKLANFYGVDPEEIFEEAYGDPKVSSPVPSPERQIVRPIGPGPRRQFGQPTIINRVYLSDEELQRLFEGHVARGYTEAGDEVEVMAGSPS
jgi:transcriptional regulator with XRE-family HTH domain